MLVMTRVGQPAWHSPTDFGNPDKDRLSISGGIAVAQQGVIHAGSGGHRLLEPSKLYQLDEIGIQSKQLVEILIDVLACGANQNRKKLTHL